MIADKGAIDEGQLILHSMTGHLQERQQDVFVDPFEVIMGSVIAVAVEVGDFTTCYKSAEVSDGKLL